MSARRSGSGPGWALLVDCNRCGRPKDRCGCTDAPSHGGPGVIRLRMERRRGKPVTVLMTQGIAESQLRALGKELRAVCGSGGTLRADSLELQGEHRDRLRAMLSARGYRIKG